MIKETRLLIGHYDDDSEDVPGWNINLVKNEIWSDGDIVPCNCVTITSTTDEKSAEYMKSVVKESAVFMIAFELGITQFEARKMFVTASTH